MALIAGLSAAVVTSHEVLTDYGPEPKIQKEVYEFAAHHTIAAIHKGGGGGVKEMRLAAANMVYDRTRSNRQVDERGPPAGKPVTDVVKAKFDDSEGYFFEIPLTWANQRLHFTREGSRNDTSSPVTCRVADNNVYVPVDDFDARVQGWLTKRSRSRNRRSGGPFQFFHQFLSEQLEDTVEDFAESVQKTTDQLERLEQGGFEDKLWQTSGYDRKIQAVMEAVSEHPDGEFGEWFPAVEIYQWIEWYAAEKDGFLANQVSKIDGPKALSQLLKDSGNPDVQYQKKGGPRLFKLEYAPYGRAKQVTINEPADVEELPCLEALTDHLHKGKPTRFMLFTLVRILIDLGFTNEEIKDYYSQFSWYDERKTSYQTNYERRQAESGSGAVPISCNNDNKQFSQFCIGRDVCDYSIYQSLPFEESVYERLDDGQSGSGFTL